jgi:hypothetical protein
MIEVKKTGTKKNFYTDNHTPFPGHLPIHQFLLQTELSLDQPF